MNAAYRLCSEEYDARSGAGSALRGGRWNSPGVELVYSSVSASLAALEVLVHFDLLPSSYLLFEIGVPDWLSHERLPDCQLPSGWDSATGSSAARNIGDSWSAAGTSCILSVPSSVVETERNLLINPAHRDFTNIVFLAGRHFAFDHRLK